MIEGNPFVDDKASMVPDKGGAVVKSTARFDGENRIANVSEGVDANTVVDSVGQVLKGIFDMVGQIVASKNGAATTTPVATIQKKDNSAMWVLVGLVAVALVVGLLFFMKRRK